VSIYSEVYAKWRTIECPTCGALPGKWCHSKNNKLLSASHMGRINQVTDPHFDGSTYEPELDHVRLTGQLQRVYSVMKDGRWRTLNNISVLASGPESSIGARIRDLRKAKFGEYQVDRKRDSINKGTFLYRLVKPQQREMGI